jgi:uncharacterized protein (TIGR03083 family)
LIGVKYLHGNWILAGYLKVWEDIPMTDRKKDIIEKLRKNEDEIVAFYRALTSDALNVRVYSDGARWTVKQVLAHFITIERSMQRLFRNILEGGPGASEDFDIERFNRSQPAKLDAQSLEDLIRSFRAVRKETAAMVADMAADDLDRTGRHPFHGQGQLERFIRWAYEHTQLHEADIRRALQTGGE